MSLTSAIVLFLLATAVIGVAGWRAARFADILADRTGIGEAIFGAVLLGACTSLPGMVTTITAASQGHPDLAISNAIGGLAVQTMFLAIADMAYRPANLEHAAASVQNMMQGALLILLLALVLLMMAAPAVAVAGVHPGSIGLIIAYALGLRVVGSISRFSTWQAQQTPETVLDEPDPHGARAHSSASLWTRFAIGMALLIAAGYAVALSGAVIARETGLSETVVGGLFTAIATSLPELVTSVAAVRQGALTLAVGNIIGGNSFEVLFVALADFAFRGGSIYHAISERQVFIIALCMAMVAVLLLGLLRREKHGIANIGFESFAILLLYAAGFAVLVFW